MRGTAVKRGRPSRRVRLRRGRLPADALRELAENLRSGAVAIFPTETVYGLGTGVFSREGIRRIYQLKGRQWRKPLALLVHSLEAAAPLVEDVPPEAHRLAARFCPGPITLVLRASPLGRLVTGGLPTIGLRIPDHPFPLALLRQLGVPLAATSVNRSGERPAVSGAACARLFGGRVDWLIDGGVCRVKTASSVVDLSAYPFAVRREGAVSKKALERFLSES